MGPSGLLHGSMLWVSLSVVPSPFARERLEAMANAAPNLSKLPNPRSRCRDFCTRAFWVQGYSGLSMTHRESVVLPLLRLLPAYI